MREGVSTKRGYRRRRRPEERVNILGGEVDLVRPEEVLHHVQINAASGRRFVVANHNAHSFYLLGPEPELADFYRDADLIEVDSTPVIFFARLLGLRSRQFHRCTYLDWRDQFWSLAEKNRWRVYYLGGAPGVAERAAKKIRAAYPGVVLATRHGYFDPETSGAENRGVIDAISAFRPQILFVGMGMPRQELWIHRNKRDLPPCVIFSVGAAFDYEAGVQRTAPRWTGRLGLEWVFRLAADPRRLFRRYCVEPWSLVGRAVNDVLILSSKRRIPATLGTSAEIRRDRVEHGESRQGSRPAVQSEHPSASDRALENDSVM
jgi:N-acetylglucosaminyldiphosphoundecaprenol N-acetyl-beta-D-mannosaminyltransferase